MSHQQAIDLPPSLTTERILQLKETHVGTPTSRIPLCDGDWLCFGYAVESAARAPLEAEIKRLADRSRSAAPVAVPEGFVLVPREPTEAMILAGAGTRGMKAIDDSCTTMQLRGYSIDPEAFKGGAPLAQAWRAMLAAAPLATPLAPAETVKPWRDRLPCPFDDADAWDRLTAALAEIKDLRAALAAPPGLAPLVAGVGEVL